MYNRSEGCNCCKKENVEQQPVQYHDDDKDPCRANDGNAKLFCMTGIK